MPKQKKASSRKRVRFASSVEVLTKPLVSAKTGAGIAKPLKPILTKRVQVEAVSAADADRYRQNEAANKEALEKIYNYYYANGRRMSKDQQLKRLYGLMGKGSAGYVRKPLTSEQWQAFKAQPNARINGQNVSAYRQAWADHHAAYDKWSTDDSDTGPAPTPPPGPEDNDESIAAGDYFHVHNQLRDKGIDPKGRARRIIVNVKTQEAGLKVAGAMNGLFTDPVAGPNLREYKIYLSGSDEEADKNKQVKHDKLVIYYAAADSDDGSDAVGDRIVEAIDGSITKDDVDESFAPFYSRISPGIAWAEEPKQYVERLKGSFTRTRSDIIASVITRKAQIPTKEEFFQLVDLALIDKQVDPLRPHRHLAD